MEPLRGKIFLMMPGFYYWWDRSAIQTARGPVGTTYFAQRYNALSGLSIKSEQPTSGFTGGYSHTATFVARGPVGTTLAGREFPLGLEILNPERA